MNYEPTKKILAALEGEKAERLKAALRSVFDDPTIDEIKTEELLGEYPAISKRRFKISTVFPCLLRRRRSTG